MTSTPAAPQSPARSAAPAPPRLSDPASVAQYLLSFEWPFQNRAVSENLVFGGLPLWLEILRTVPEPAQRGRLLELGSPPFHITLLVQKFRNYDMSLTGAAVDGRPRLEQYVASPTYGEEFTFDCTCFDIEHERFPYPDNHFDVVMWCEVIEHLTENPVFTLHEIHRILKPGGAVVISTPNVARAENLQRLFLGLNPYDPYHLGTPLRGSRHSREYTLQDLKELLTGCGFRIDVAEGRDLRYPMSFRIRRPLQELFRLFSRVLPNEHADHLFVRALKDGPFCWAFAPNMFDIGHLVWYVQACDREVIMGRNDIPHTSIGWGSVQATPDGKTRRLAGSPADAYLISDTPVDRVVLEVWGDNPAAMVEVQVWQGKGPALHQFAMIKEAVPAGRWSTLQVPLASGVQVGLELQLRIFAEGGVYVHRLALEP